MELVVAADEALDVRAPLGAQRDCEHCYLGEKQFAGLDWPGRERLLQVLADAGVLWLQLTEVIADLADRIAEARINGWLGEVENLHSLNAARGKLAALDRTVRNSTGTADLGMPAIRPASREAP